VTRDHQRARGIAIAAAGLPGLVLEPAAQEAAHEAVARAQGIEHLDRKSGSDQSLAEPLRDLRWEDDAALRPALDHDRGPGRAADAAHRLERVGRAAGDVDLLLRANHEIAIGQDRLQVPGHLGTGHKAGLAGAMAGEAPEHGPVVDVEDHPGAGGARMADCRPAGSFGARRREVGPGDQQGRGRGDEPGVDVLRTDRHVRTVAAIEDVREGLAVPDAQDHQRGQPLRVGADVGDVDAFRGQRAADEATHLLVADASDQAARQPQARGADGDVGGAAADVLGKGLHVLEQPADLLPVEIDGRAAEADDIEPPPAHPALSPFLSARRCPRLTTRL